MTRKLNEIRRTAKFSWNPGHYRILATGTLAGSLNDSFSTTSELELFEIDPDYFTLQPSHKVNTTSRFNTLAWGSVNSSKTHGVIAGGMESGDLELWDPSAILDNKSEAECLILRNATHSGTLAALDFNLFQTNLLASAGSKSEVYIWDLNQPTTPFTPGARSSKMDEISSVAWNCQVQHIVSTASTSGYTVIWDLRNKKEVMALAYQGSGRGSISSIDWHPDIATQIVTASNEDQNPIISLWDLRHAQSPEKVLSGHNKGVLDVSWSKQDSDLLLSSGKDGKTLCWNPNTGELNGKVSNNKNWAFEVDWCPRHPNLLASASFDGSINVFSIQDKPLNDPSTSPSSSFHLKHPPKWLRRPVGASFGFSGKLVTFTNKPAQAAISAATVSNTNLPNLKSIPRPITITTIETNPEIIKRSEQLESATENNVHTLIEDRIKAEKHNNQDWKVLQALFSDHARENLVQYLGFEKDQVIAAANSLLPPTKQQDTVSTLFSETLDPESGFFFGSSSPVKSQKSSSHPFRLYDTGSSDETSKLITDAIVVGDFESAVNVCLATDRFSDAIMIAMYGGPELLARTQKTYFETQSKKFSYLRLLQGIVEDDLTTIVRDADLKDWNSILVVLCTFAKPADFARLCEALGDRLVQDIHHQSHATLLYLAAGHLEKVSSIWNSQFDQETTTQENRGVRLQALVEKVTIFRKAIDYQDQATLSESGKFVLAGLYEKYCEYAELMASQGQLEVALKYMSLTPKEYDRMSGGAVVRDRVFHASRAAARQKIGHQEEPSFPFEKKIVSNNKQPTEEILVTCNNNLTDLGLNDNITQNNDHSDNTATTIGPLPEKSIVWNHQPSMRPGPNKKTLAAAAASTAAGPAGIINRMTTTTPFIAPIRAFNGRPPPPPPSSNTTLGYYSAHQQFQTRATTPPQLPTSPASPPPPPLLPLLVPDNEEQRSNNAFNLN